MLVTNKCMRCNSELTVVNAEEAAGGCLSAGAPTHHHHGQLPRHHGQGAQQMCAALGSSNNLSRRGKRSLVYIGRMATRDMCSSGWIIH